MRKICVVTGTRADYGLLYWLLKEIQNDSDLKLQIIATGTHLDASFGSTDREIEKDGFQIAARVKIPVAKGDPVYVAHALGQATIGMADALSSLQPDLLVVLGDRYEILAATQAAMILQIPIAHLHGGESTEGAIDEAVRHSVTKMSHLHFVAAEEYRRRVIQLGEVPEHVFLVGAMGLENIRRAKYLTREEFSQKIGFDLGSETFIVTYHPVTLEKAGPEPSVGELFAALDEFPDAKTIFTMANSDTFGDRVNHMIKDYCDRNSSRARLFSSLGSPLYLSAIKNVDVVIGNSSSGIVEAPALKKPTVNIGDRQRGRLRASTVIDCRENKKEIAAAIRRALSPEFQKVLVNPISLYGDGNASVLVKDELKRADLSAILMKRFFDLKGQT